MAGGNGAAIVNPVRVLAVDATPLVRHGLRTVIQHATGLHWLGALDRPEAIEAALRTARPHVVIVGSTVDLVDGLVRDLAAPDPAPTVITLLDEQHRTADHVRAVRIAGAHGVLRHDVTPQGLVAAIQQAHTIGRYIDPGLIMVGPPRPRAAAGTDELLTKRQREVLELIAHGMNEGAIATRLVVSPDTVRSHIKHLRRRLGARDRAHAVARGYHLGVLPMPAD